MHATAAITIAVGTAIPIPVLGASVLVEPTGAIVSLSITNATGERLVNVAVIVPFPASLFTTSHSVPV